MDKNIPVISKNNIALEVKPQTTPDAVPYAFGLYVILGCGILEGGIWEYVVVGEGSTKWRTSMTRAHKVRIYEKNADAAV